MNTFRGMADLDPPDEGDMMATEIDYRYPRFRRELLLHDLAFEGGPRPDEPFPDFDLPTADRGRVAKSDFVGDRPLLMVFASVT